MNTGIISSEPEIIELEEALVDLTADLLSLQAYEDVLKDLFNKPAGIWSDLTDFLVKDQPVAQEMVSLQSDCNGTVRVTWLEHPELAQGYCLVLFYMGALGWNNLALYNKARLDSSASR